MAKKSAKNKTILVVLIIAILCVGAAGYIKLSQSDETASKTTTTAGKTAGPTTDSTSTTTTKAATAAAANNPSHPTTSTLAKPIGPSNNVRSVSLSGSTGMESTCRGAAGASCTVQATKDGRTITVSGAKVIGDEAGSDGVILDWDASQLTPGVWNTQAVITKDGQTATSDSQTLTVSS